MEIVIRDAEMQDIDAMIELLVHLFTIETGFKVDPQRHRKGLVLLLAGCRKNKCIKVAEVESKVIGMCCAQTLISTVEGGNVTMLEDMVVSPDYQRCGIGRKLMDSIEAWAIDRGSRRMQLLADRTNFTALDFYDRLGWHPTRLICLRRKW